MGGNVFSTNVRLCKLEAEKIGNEIVELISPLSSSAAIIPSYRSKTDFGDVDILVATDYRRDGITQLLEEHPCIIERKANGDVVSCAYRLEHEQTFQVDVIFSPTKTHDFSYNYFSYNDLGNFIGRFAHKMGLKFGHDGLRFVLRDNRINYYSEVVLTTEFSKALEFLGFDSTRFYKGFDGLEDIFEFVSSNPRYYGEIFNLESRSHNARVRDKKRRSYQEILKWIAQHPEKDKQYRHDANKDVYLPEIITAFPHLQQSIDALVEEVDKRLRIKERFNGRIVSEITGLEGKLLGRFMAQLKVAGNLMSSGSFDDLILADGVNVKQFILHEYKIFLRRIWREKILDDPSNWEASPIADWSDLDEELFVRKHPQLIKYIKWDSLSQTTKDLLIQKHPDIFMVFV